VLGKADLSHEQGKIDREAEGIVEHESVRAGELRSSRRQVYSKDSGDGLGICLSKWIRLRMLRRMTSKKESKFCLCCERYKNSFWLKQRAKWRCEEMPLYCSLYARLWTGERATIPCRHPCPSEQTSRTGRYPCPACEGKTSASTQANCVMFRL
jgi:hypothetical protein